jgi:hypothetical protein
MASYLEMGEHKLGRTKACGVSRIRLAFGTRPEAKDHTASNRSRFAVRRVWFRVTTC